MRAACLTPIALVVPMALVIAPAHAAPKLAPFRAVYDLSLKNATEKSGIERMTGRMAYEFRGSPCDGYTATLRFVTQTDHKEFSRLDDQQTTTFEDSEGKNYRFVNRFFVDQKLEREVTGDATRNESEVSVELEKPEPGTFELGATQFPTQHLLELLQKAQVGENFYETSLFEGNDADPKAMITTVVIGKPTEPSKDDLEAAALGSLAGKKYWPIDMAYFDGSNEGGEETPEVRISFKLYDDGFQRDFFWDYGDFSLAGKLVNVTMLEPSGNCQNQ